MHATFPRTLVLQFVVAGLAAAAAAAAVAAVAGWLAELARLVVILFSHH